MKLFRRCMSLLLALLLTSALLSGMALAQNGTGFGEENGNWYYYVNGSVDQNCNDIIQGTVNGTDGWWYVVAGKVDFSYTGVSNFSNAYGWWYIRNGKVDFSKTGVEQNKNGWWRVVNGKVDFNCNSVEENDYGWWYLVGGKVQFGYTGVANFANDYGWWYIKDGKVDFSKTGVEQNNNGWWRVVNGKVDFSCNSVEENDYGWWYLVGGKVQFGYTGVTNYPNAYGYWYVKGGKVDFSKNSVEQNNYGWWYVLGGKVQTDYTGVADYANDFGWWYIKNGKVDFNFDGLAENNYGLWVVRSGKVDFSHSVEINKDMADQVLTLVNQERAKEGLSALTTNATLQELAQIRAFELSENFDHYRPDGSMFFTVFTDNNLLPLTSGENIARSQKTAEKVVSDWMNSDGHRANILSSDFQCLGVACVKVDGVYYWEQLFSSEIIFSF